MKKIYTILSAVLCLSVGAKAQRTVDLQATLTAPVNNTTFNSGQTVAFNAVIKNVGTTTFQTNDTLYYGYLIDGTQITFNIGGQSVTTFGIVNRTLAPNDTIQINKSFSLTIPATLAGKRQFCIAIRPLNRGIDSMIDNNIANNASCDSVLFDSNPLAVGELEATLVENAVTKVYPNPAQSYANIDMDLSVNTAVSVRIFDITGRMVIQTNEKTYGKGKQTISLNTMNVQNGLYIYQVVMDGQVSAGKLLINK
ncbi:T9SS type A sorting domain-containing protein [Taibaiella soli]|uniref:Secretion system C-terminal sorting domain-containing protein n=1 Tax=Taibaiella soli TaxID=1649169 RepID=A0A2W2BB87_9BACT|nr:T9SS type A sorting domain-containing protein [Taibaiella soli]PZF73449.1 hypothetical protein DN068_07905 [Taibaiella soli]